MTEMSTGELGRRLEDLSTQLREGFAGVNGRLDRVNGQLDTHRGQIAAQAVTLAEHRTKLSTVNHELFRRRRSNGDEGEDEAARRGSEPITRRDLALVGGAVFALIELVRWLPALFAAGQVAP